MIEVDENGETDFRGGKLRKTGEGNYVFEKGKKIISYDNGGERISSQ